MEAPRNLLIVDDNEINCDLLSRRLKRQGFSPVTAPNGQEALDRIQQQKCLIDLILLDIMLPDINGIDILKMLRAQYSPSQLPIIMVTAKDRSEDIVAALAEGANDYVTKPVDFAVALARIQTHLGLKKSQEALSLSEERYNLAMKGANDALWDWNLKENVLYYSPRFENMLGYKEGVFKHTPEEWFNRVYPSDLEILKAKLAAHFEKKTPFFESQYRMLHRDGSYCWVQNRGLVIFDEQGNPYRMAGSQRDITESITKDSLTALPSYVLFEDRLEREFAQAGRDKSRFFSVLYFNVNKFKEINESFDFLAGDKLLVAISKRLYKQVRESDTVSRYTLSRFVGDEFFILLHSIKSPTDAVRVAVRILKCLEQPFPLNSQDIYITASIGIAFYSERYLHHKEILRDASVAASRAKTKAQNGYEIFDEEMQTQAKKTLLLENEIHTAVKQKQFTPYYQPIIELGSQKIVGLEVLARWRHPSRGLLAPVHFISHAEETGLIVELDRYLLLESAHQLSEWLKEFPEQTLYLSVNLSSKQFSTDDLVKFIGGFLQTISIDPKYIHFEMTETVLTTHTEQAKKVFKDLSSLGVQLGLDDFGTGYSSLSYLYSFPVNFMKIDRSFISRLETEKKSRMIVRTILSLANTLGCDVIAEGIETSYQLEFLKQENCPFAQGYFFAKPMEAGAIEAVLKNHRMSSQPWNFPLS